MFGKLISLVIDDRLMMVLLFWVSMVCILCFSENSMLCILVLKMVL